MATVYMSEAELSRNLHAALKQAQSGVDVVVELADRPVVIRASGRAGVAVRPPGSDRRRVPCDGESPGCGAGVCCDSG